MEELASITIDKLLFSTEVEDTKYLIMILVKFIRE